MGGGAACGAKPSAGTDGRGGEGRGGGGRGAGGRGSGELGRGADCWREPQPHCEAGGRERTEVAQPGRVAAGPKSE